MYKLDQLKLMTGVDIFIPEFKVKIHQPTIREIALLGEERFFYCLNCLTINKESVIEKLSENIQDENKKKTLNDLDEITILRGYFAKDSNLRLEFENLCSLLIQDYEVQILPNKIMFESYKPDIFPSFEVSNEFFIELMNITQQIFRLERVLESSSFNPKGKLAEKIASKMQKSREKVQQLNGNEQENKGSVFAYYLSILGIGSNALTIDILQNLTIYQLYDQLERFNLYSQYDQGVKSALAGAKVDIVDWLKKI